MVYKTLIATAFVILFAKAGNGQITETFSDGNYTSNPAWTVSNAADWIVNASSQLQSNNTTANSTFD